jgi:hypothetical protein
MTDENPARWGSKGGANQESTLSGKSALVEILSPDWEGTTP